jgi:hypothetical protein
VLQVDASEVLSLCKELAFVDNHDLADSRQKLLYMSHVAVAESFLFGSVNRAFCLHEAWDILGKASAFLEDVHAHQGEVRPPWCGEAEQQVRSD